MGAASPQKGPEAGPWSPSIAGAVKSSPVWTQAAYRQHTTHAGWTIIRPTARPYRQARRVPVIARVAGVALVQNGK